MKIVILRFSGDDIVADEIATDLTSNTNAGIELQKVDFDEDSYDLQGPYKSEFGQILEFTLKILSAAIAALTLKGLATKEFLNSELKDKSVEGGRPTLYIVIDGREYNLAEIPESDLKRLLEREDRDD